MVSVITVVLFVGFVVLVPLSWLALFGWAYGKSDDTSPLGFAIRIIVSGTIGSWAFVYGGGGIVPLPSLLCSYYSFTEPGTKCMPWGIASAVLSVSVYVGFCIAASRRYYGGRKERHW